MSLMSKIFCSPLGRCLLMMFALLASLLFSGEVSFAEEAGKMHGEADLELPDLNSADFMGMPGKTWLYGGMAICLAGLAFGYLIFNQLKNLPVHKNMLEVSELIYETCKTYLVTQGKFLAILWVAIAAVIILYFGYLQQQPLPKVVIILGFSVIGILGSYLVAWFGIRVNTFANSRTAHAS